MSRAGAGAWTTTSSQARQAYLGRRTTSTRNCAGTTSSFSLTSSPIRCSAPLQHGQVLSSTSTSASKRGRCAGRAPRLARRLRAPSARARRRLRFGLGGRLRLALLGVLERQQQLVFRQALGATAEAVTLQLLDDLNEPLGALTLGDQHRLQRFWIVGKRLDRLRHGPTTP